MSEFKIGQKIKVTLNGITNLFDGIVVKTKPDNEKEAFRYPLIKINSPLFPPDKIIGKEFYNIS